MKFAAASLLLAAASCVSAAEEPTLGLRGLQSNGNAYGKMKKACTILLAADLRIPGSENSGVRRGLQSGSDLNAPEESIDCELDPEDANGEYGQIMKLNLDPAQEQYMREAIADGSLISATSTYFDPEAQIDLTSFSVTAPPGKAVGWNKNGKASRNRRKLVGTQSDGVRDYLVVKVSDVNGLARSESPATISDDVFGTYGDPVNLKSQAEACSYGKLTINAASDTLIGDTQPVPAPGVIEIQVNLDLTTNDRYAMHNAVTSALNARLGTNLCAGCGGGAGKFANVLYVMQGCYVSCGYAAYAYINSWLSVYQGGYYKQVGVLMHELGHNWGMAHSGGLDGQTYTDHTCLMGNPLYSDDVGKMCFNPAKNWYLGWYSGDTSDGTPNRNVLIDPLQTPTWTGRVVGIADYKNPNAGTSPAVIKIETGTNQDFFVAFNRATGINSQNDEGDNQVTVVEMGNNGNSYSQSYLRSRMSQGGSYTWTNFRGTGKDLVLQVDAINIGADPGYADITLQLGGCTVNADCPGQVCDTATEQCVDCLSASDCTGGDLCNIASCSSNTCSYTPKNCNDNNACTTDTCNLSDGSCSSTAINCDDGNTCTTDSCDAGTGCVNTELDCSALGNASCKAGDTVCTCDSGFALVTGECKDIDECANNPCGDNTNCFNSEGSYTCACKPGFVGDADIGCSCPDGYGQEGDVCVDILCTAGICNEGTCTNNGDGSYTCNCPFGTTGSNCEGYCLTGGESSGNGCTASDCCTGQCTGGNPRNRVCTGDAGPTPPPPAPTPSPPPAPSAAPPPTADCGGKNSQCSGNADCCGTSVCKNNGRCS